MSIDVWAANRDMEIESLLERGVTGEEIKELLGGIQLPNGEYNSGDSYTEYVVVSSISRYLRSKSFKERGLL
jgi:hypothetical protein